MWQNDDFRETADLFILSCNLVILQKLILSYTLKTSTMTIKRFLNILNLKGTVKAQSCGLDFSTQTHGHLGSQSTLWWFCSPSSLHTEVWLSCTEPWKIMISAEYRKTHQRMKETGRSLENLRVQARQQLLSTALLICPLVFTDCPSPP